jgi:thiamine pyrophosphate-dependent acetolactate synthase large subunit-like protein
MKKKEEISEPVEVIQIKIDPETLGYSMECSCAYIEDIYIVLREIIHSFETGELSEAFELEDRKNGETASRERFIEIIQDVKSRFEESIEKEDFKESFASSLVGGNFRN